MANVLAVRRVECVMISYHSSDQVVRVVLCCCCDYGVLSILQVIDQGYVIVVLQVTDVGRVVWSISSI